MIEVVAFLRSKEVAVIPYLDDLLIIGQTEQELIQHRNLTITTLQQLGWCIIWEKSKLTPSKNTIFLGTLLNTSLQMSFLPPEKRDRLIQKIHHFQQQNCCTIREAMRMLGQMTACIQSVQWSQSHTRRFQCWILEVWDKNPHHLDQNIQLPPRVKIFLNRWTEMSHLMKGIPWHPWPIKVIQTDASRSGWGANLGDKLLQGQWTVSIQNRSSNYQELRAVWETLKNSASELREHHVKVYSDNITTVAYLKHQGGTRNKELLDLSENFFSWAEKHILSLKAIHLRGEDNKVADFLSRNRLDQNEWCLNDNVFQEITKVWGHPTIDLFATKTNSKVKNFYSLDSTGSGLQMDAFNQVWDAPLMYAFPPIPVISYKRFGQTRLL
ncbi:uncharacterized protein [Engystomops pustulosus]|uniref:uncharacterized protein isoform X1 n=1 Tax=Engystomops pustulosus TaxID=76066 RepID=UPI003AFA9C4C